jgi:hypothetical protein
LSDVSEITSSSLEPVLAGGTGRLWFEFMAVPRSSGGDQKA